jgi:hypothetical protein
VGITRQLLLLHHGRVVRSGCAVGLCGVGVVVMGYVGMGYAGAGDGIHWSLLLG